MKNLFLLLLLSVGLVAAPDDLILSQAKNPGPGNIQRNVAPVVNSALGFDANKVPVALTAFTQNSATGAVGVAASGSNQSITLTPSGTGAVSIPSTGPTSLTTTVTSASTASSEDPAFEIAISHTAAKAAGGKVYGELVTVEAENGATAPSGYFGLVFHVDSYSNAASTAPAYGVYGSVQTQTGGHATPRLLSGNAIFGEVRAKAGEITTARGGDVYLQADSGSTITTGEGLRVNITNAGTFTTAYGVRIPVYTGTFTTKYGFYSEERSYLSAVVSDANPALTINHAGSGNIITGTTAGSTRFTVDSTGRIDGYSGALSAVIGGNVGPTGRTDATRKNMRLAAPHYTNSEEPAAVLFVDANTSVNDLYLGGGSGTMNAATSINFYTAANNTTTSGTAAAAFGSDQALKFPSTNTAGLQLYNTADQVTTVQRLTTKYASNIGLIGTDTVGTISGTALQIYAQGNNASAVFSRLDFNATGLPTLRQGLYTTATGTTLQNNTSQGTFISFGNTINTQTAGTNNVFAITPTYNQASGTAANTDFLINRTQTAVGSGAQLLIDAQVGGASAFKVSNVAIATLAGATPQLVLTRTVASTREWVISAVSGALQVIDNNTGNVAISIASSVPNNALTLASTSGSATFAGALITTPQALSGAGAVNVTTGSTFITTTGVLEALTLANGTAEGQIKTVVHKVDGGSAVLTPTTALGFTTITFTAVGETVILQWTSAGWVILSVRGAVVA